MKETLSENFRLSEFLCPCGNCPPKGPHPELILMLQEARNTYGHPFLITSGVRCSTHNKKVGGTRNSSHLRGVAVDISCIEGKCKYKLVAALGKTNKCRGIGVYPTHIHVDVALTKAETTLWGNGNGLL